MAGGLGGSAFLLCAGFASLLQLQEIYVIECRQLQLFLQKLFIAATATNVVVFLSVLGVPKPNYCD